MKIDILTLFPEAFAPLKTSILGRAQESGALEINLVNIRDFSKDKHKKCDDTPFGGGAGMLMTVQPIYDAIMSVLSSKEKEQMEQLCQNCSGRKPKSIKATAKKAEKIGTQIVFPSPIGEVFSAATAQELGTSFEHLIFVCGHYEGVDERLFQLLPIRQISIGDYVLTGGELPTMVIVDALARFVDGVISKDSLSSESFSDGLLEYPQYTRPQEFMGLSVPQVLVSGNHGEVEKWREEQSLLRTKQLRKDLLKKKNAK